MEKWGAAIKELCAVGLGLWAIVLACIQEVKGGKVGVRRRFRMSVSWSNF